MFGSVFVDVVDLKVVGRTAVLARPAVMVEDLGAKADLVVLALLLPGFPM